MEIEIRYRRGDVFNFIAETTLPSGRGYLSTGDTPEEAKEKLIATVKNDIRLTQVPSPEKVII